MTNRRGALPAGIDVRGEGGYVIFPPSRLPDGRDPCGQSAGFAEAPDWLYALIEGKPPMEVAARRSNPRRENSCPRFRLCRDRFATGMRSCSDRGSWRTQQQAKSSGLQPRAIGCRRMLKEERVIFELYQAAAMCGLRHDDGEHAVRATIASGLRAGKSSHASSLAVRMSRSKMAALSWCRAEPPKSYPKKSNGFGPVALRAGSIPASLENPGQAKANCRSPSSQKCRPAASGHAVRASPRRQRYHS